METNPLQSASNEGRAKLAARTRRPNAKKISWWTARSNKQRPDQGPDDGSAD